MSQTPDDPAQPPTTTAPEAAAPPAAAAESVPAETEPTESAVVDDVRALVDPVHVRRAPRYRGFLVAGGVVGLAAGAALGLFLLATFDPARDEPLSKPGVWFSVTVLATTTFGTLIGGLLATIADRRSLRRWRARQDADRAV